MNVQFKNLPAAAKSFIYFVALPTLLSAIYYAFIASDIYISEARYAVRKSSDASQTAGLMNSFMNTSTTTLSEDSKIVMNYILSRDMMDELIRDIDLKHHYESNDIDYFSRLPSDATFENFYEYYENIIEVERAVGSSISVLKVRSFSGDFSQKIASVILSKSEALVNKMSDRIIEDTVQFARNEVVVAEEKVRRESDALSRFRNKTKSIDPTTETAAVLGIVTELESSLAQVRSELLEAKSYMKSDSTQVKRIEIKIDALKNQIKNERQRLATDKDGVEDYSQLIYDYEPLQLNKLLAEQQYASALTSLEVARVEAQLKQRYLIAFVSPKIPDEAIEPERIMKTLTIFFAALLTYAIGGLIWAAIKDHMRN